MGFPRNWLAWIKNAVLSGTSQIIVNGLVGKKIILKRGVRQGDPISPMLFIMAMDFVTRWFSKLVVTGAWRLPFQDMKPCLLYADDALFFLKPEARQIQMLKIALAAFERISGLAVNLTKSELVIAKDVGTLGQELAAQIG